MRRPPVGAPEGSLRGAPRLLAEGDGSGSPRGVQDHVASDLGTPFLAAGTSGSLRASNDERADDRRPPLVRSPEMPECARTAGSARSAPSGPSDTPAVASTRPDERLRAGDRVKERTDFRRIQNTGRKVHTPHFVLAVSPRIDGGAGTRLGITVTRKIAHAVGRNRVKRVFREVFRRHRRLFPGGCDVVAIAKSDAHRLGFDEVLAEVTHAHRALLGAGRPRSGGRSA